MVDSGRYFSDLSEGNRNFSPDQKVSFFTGVGEGFVD